LRPALSGNGVSIFRRHPYCRPSKCRHTNCLYKLSTVKMSTIKLETLLLKLQIVQHLCIACASSVEVSLIGGATFIRRHLNYGLSKCRQRNCRHYLLHVDITY
jgi:hypothetical protein